MMKLKTLCLVSLAAILTACATATPYQAATKNGASGYTQTKIENNRYNVSFSGNSLTSQETVETYLLYRSAELAVENGFDYFKVAEKETDTASRVIAMPSLSYGFGRPYYSGFACSYDFYNPRVGWRSTYRPFYRRRHSLALNHAYGLTSRFGSPFYDPFYDDFNYREMTRFTAKADVIMGRGAKPSDDNAFDAREILENLGPKVIFPEDKA